MKPGLPLKRCCDAKRLFGTHGRGKRVHVNDRLFGTHANQTPDALFLKRVRPRQIQVNDRVGILQIYPLGQQVGGDKQLDVLACGWWRAPMSARGKLCDEVISRNLSACNAPTM